MKLFKRVCAADVDRRILMRQSSRRLQFTHFLVDKVREIRFRFLEINEVCQESRVRFLAQQEQPQGNGQLVNYRFAAFSSLIQTIKDIHPIVFELNISWSSLSHIRHFQFMHSIRNAITHDGNSVINLWVDGRYYVACDFVRLGQNQKPVMVKVPTEDIHTIILEFTEDLCSYLYNACSQFLGDESLVGPLYGQEFFSSAINHSAIPQFAKCLYGELGDSDFQQVSSEPLSEALEELGSLAALCREVSRK